MESGYAQPWFYGMSQAFSISRNHPYTTWLFEPFCPCAGSQGRSCGWPSLPLLQLMSSEERGHAWPLLAKIVRSELSRVRSFRHLSCNALHALIVPVEGSTGAYPPTCAGGFLIRGALWPQTTFY